MTLRIPNLGNLDGPICAVVQLAHQTDGVIHQVVLDPAKVKEGDGCVLIRLGEWPGDQAHGWQHVGNVRVLAVLGRASLDNEKTVRVVPIEEEKGVS